MAKRTRADGAPAAPPKPKRRPRSPDAASATYALPVTVEGDAPWPPYLYVKRHAEAGTGPPRAAFVSGLPPTWRPVQDVVAAVFGVVGGVDTVIVHKDERSAIVSYASPSSLTELLALAKGDAPLVANLPPPETPFGLKAWVEDHKAAFPGNDVLQKKLDSWVAAYEDEEARRKAAAAAAAAEDGWTVVVRHGGRKKTSGDGVSVGAVAPAVAAAALQAKQAKQESDFYRFQRREAKRNELADLRAKFEEDNKRVAALRESRRFRPS